jgi:hypothetical protein
LFGIDQLLFSNFPKLKRLVDQFRHRDPFIFVRQRKDGVGHPILPLFRVNAQTGFVEPLEIFNLARGKAKQERIKELFNRELIPDHWVACHLVEQGARK